MTEADLKNALMEYKAGKITLVGALAAVKEYIAYVQSVDLNKKMVK